MGKRQDKSVGENAEPEAVNAPPNEPAVSASTPAATPSPADAPPPAEAAHPAIANDLPMVEAPKLDGIEPDAMPADDVDAMPMFDFARPGPEMPGEAAPDGEVEAGPGVAAREQRSFRFAMLAATVALAAGAGSLIGSFTAWGFAHRAPAAAATIAVPRTADTREVVQALKSQIAQLNALKLNIENATRNANGQFIKITERLDAIERAAADRTAKLTHVTEAVDKFDKRPAPPTEITGSIGAKPTPPPVQKPNAPILSDWIVRDVRNGRAMVESPYGGLFLVSAGSMLPGVGRVEAVRRQDGDWVVVTANGIITSERD